MEVKSKIRWKTLCVRSDRIENWPKKGQIARKKTGKPKNKKKTGKKLANKNNEKIIARKKTGKPKKKNTGKKLATGN